jgi:hypothetical protein
VEIAITRSWFGGQVQGFQCARHRHPENPGLLHRVNQMHWKPALALDLGNPRRADPGHFSAKQGVEDDHMNVLAWVEGP